MGRRDVVVTTDEKVRENRLRRAARRQGLTLTRSRRRDTRAIDYGLYWLASQDGTVLTAPGGSPIDAIETYLNR